MKNVNFKEDPFYPVQPFFVLNTEHYYKKQCKNSAVSHYYGFRAEKNNQYANYVVPDNTIDILFECNKEQPSAFVCGSVSRRMEHEFQNGKEYFGVRFVPGKVKGFLKVSSGELLDHCVDLKELAGTEELPWRIAQAENFQERMDIFQEYLYREDACLKLEKSVLVDYMLKRIHESSGEIQLGELALEMQYSIQYIRRCFAEYVGMSPKRFCRQLRFQHALKQLNANKNSHISDISQDTGYYDQAHMLKDFQTYMGVSPSRYARIINLKKYGNQILYV